ncbi:hypothetical protein F5876DRAFT_74169 [Lentinula aff. lateritia]|uniref:Uncharacterized protein n=1 Tax=Lentinula aff. lateritia TaxID=2804960 RepID=A0ACC1U8M9_9AGAR|nr:hypothetical protein F5876DRAFT_74169 [Lentinula aff. lateritia]
MAAPDIDKSLRRSNRRPSTSTTPLLAKDTEGGSLRRSARVGRLPARYSRSATAGTTPSHFPLSASNKRKRTSSTSKERSAGRAFKRSHIIQADTPTANNSPPADRDNTSSVSARSQRYQRRHPSVFNGGVSESGTSQAIASTSYLPPLVVDNPIDSTQRRTRKKANFLGERIITGSRGSTWDSVKRSADISPSVHTPRTPTLKGKERDPGPSSVVYDNASPTSWPSFSMGKFNQVADDDLPEPMRSKLTSPPQKTAELPVSVGADHEATQSVMKSQSPASLRRLRSLAQATAKALLTKRKRASSTGVPTGKKKPKIVEIEDDIQDEEDPDASTPFEDAGAVTTVPSEPTIPLAATLPYPMSLPNPIPTLSVTPPTPPNSPPPVPSSDPIPHDHCSVPSIEDRNKAGQDIDWNSTGTQPVVPAESSAWEYALSSAQSNDHAEASSSPDDVQRGREAIRSPRARGPRQNPRQVARVTERPSETLFTLACRERSLKSIANRRYYYMGQLKDYEADQAFQFFTRVSDSSRFSSSEVSSFTSDDSVVPPSRPQSPTWSIALHWEDRLQDAGEWDGHIHAMHPASPIASSSVLPPSIIEARNTNQDVSDRELDFRTEDCFPFELAESDEEEEEHPEQPSLSDPPSDPDPSTGANVEEEHEDTESDESDESEDPSSVHGENEMELNLPVYMPTPSSLAEALTPLAPSESPQNFTTGVFALPVALPPKKPETPQDLPPFITRSPFEEKTPFAPPPLSIPPPPLATIVPAQARLYEADQLSETFQQEILPDYQADKVRELSQNDVPPAFSSSATPAVLRAEIQRQADIRLRTPYSRLLNYASRKLGSIGHGTPIDPNRRRNLIAWLEDRKVVNNTRAISEKVFVQHGPERLPPLGSSAWYAMRFPTTLSFQPVLKSTAVKPDAFITSTGPTASSPQALLAGTQQQQLEAQTSFETDWPPLTVQPGDLETFRNHNWMDAKTYFVDEGVSSSDIMQNVDFQQGSSRGCGTDQAQYQYSLANHSATPNTNRNLNQGPAPNIAPSRFSPKIAMDENLSDEDAEGDIDPDVVQSVSEFTSSPSNDPASSGGNLMTTGVHENRSYSPSTAGMDSFSDLPPDGHSNGGIGFDSSGPNSGFHNSRMGIYSGTVALNANDVVGHGTPNSEAPLSGTVPNRSFADTNPAGFPDSGIQGIEMNLNVGVSVGFGMGMGINRFGMDMMGVGLGMIGFPVVETDSWFLPASSPPSASLPTSSANGEHHDHGVGGMGPFGNNSIYNDPLPDHARERFGSPGSPENAYPLGFAMVTLKGTTGFVQTFKFQTLGSSLLGVSFHFPHSHRIAVYHRPTGFLEPTDFDWNATPPIIPDPSATLSMWARPISSPSHELE